MEKIAETVAILGAIASVSLILVYWQLLPAVIPNHFNVAGQANGYGPKTDLLIPVGLGLIIYLALTAVVVFRQRLMEIFRIKIKVPESKCVLIRAMLTWFKAEIVWSCVLMEASLINASMHYNYSLALIMPLPAILIILTFLYYVARLARPGWIKI